MPASFDDVLTIDGDGCLSPAGPLVLDPGETVLRFDAWVFQTGGACMAFVLGPFGGTRWTTNPDPHDDHFGDRFQPGPATAMGLMVSKKATGQTVTFQWTRGILLK
ncbi:hypothetical protein [Mesorhizobium sp. M00.F.Ca.ET.216.01.1.1]|uniref:hypothetical protein n=1 Tax=Mesorhizobium sp. M00.F.Ca.ET.216.01.1.1 TaxID=2500528 RepID=UPI000FD9B616|nr:hypothetical protein [Mesorhizobium sp. M00.F.Ca.ET.216.01.1.1]TGQ37226.1 hypothetical protein EN859_019585 [Mesorhizobium sp. M00.F.Ca.ET.216.01.1.1]